VCLEGQCDVRILLIDPDCDQAWFRSYREYLILNPEGTVERFENTDRFNKRLVRDTIDSITEIKQLRKELEKGGKGTKFSAKMFRSAPEAFLFLTDKSVIIEQYHYGKAGSEESVRRRETLEGEVPLIEYGLFCISPRKGIFQLSLPGWSGWELGSTPGQ
jgi:hypothetical protein